MSRALVTGAGVRLGREMALYLARRGHDLALHYASSAEACGEDLAAEIRAHGPALPSTLAGRPAGQEEQSHCAAATRRPRRWAGRWPAWSTTPRSSNMTPCHQRHPRQLGPAYGKQPAGALRADPGDGGAGALCNGRLTANGEPLAAGLIVNMIDMRVRKLTPEFMSYTHGQDRRFWTLTRTAAQALAPAIRVNAHRPRPDPEGTPSVRGAFCRPAGRQYALRATAL